MSVNEFRRAELTDEDLNNDGVSKACEKDRQKYETYIVCLSDAESIIQYSSL